MALRNLLLGSVSETVQGKIRAAALLAGAALLGAALVVGTGGLAQADPSAGQRIVEQVCQQCHGLDGIALIDEAPNLSGQKRSYLARQLWAFRAGERQDPKMSPSAIGLSDQDIIDVSEWYSSVHITVEAPQ
jgi:cytochrome c553